MHLWSIAPVFRVTCDYKVCLCIITPCNSSCNCNVRPQWAAAGILLGLIICMPHHEFQTTVDLTYGCSKHVDNTYRRIANGLLNVARGTGHHFYFGFDRRNRFWVWTGLSMWCVAKRVARKPRTNARHLTDATAANLRWIRLERTACTGTIFLISVLATHCVLEILSLPSGTRVGASAKTAYCYTYSTVANQGVRAANCKGNRDESTASKLIRALLVARICCARNSDQVPCNDC